MKIEDEHFKNRCLILEYFDFKIIPEEINELLFPYWIEKFIKAKDQEKVKTKFIYYIIQLRNEKYISHPSKPCHRILNLFYKN